MKWNIFFPISLLISSDTPSILLAQTKMDPLTSLSVGNGAFAFTVDVTGLQTSPKEYENGVSLGTQTDWGWNGFRNTLGYKLTEAIKP